VTASVVANLDVESRLGGLELPRKVLARLSAVGTLLRAYADEGDALWTPSAVEPARMVSVTGLPRPRLVSGGPAPGSARVAWCSHGDAALLDRTLDLALAEQLGCALPGACIVRSQSALRAGLESQASGRWDLKPLLSAAGRGHLHGAGRLLDDGREVADLPAIRAGLRAGGFLLEPRLERTSDHGCRAEVRGGRVRILGMHRLLVDALGRFRGISMAADPTGTPTDLGDQDAGRFRETAQRVGQHLATLGYEGPFGLDGWSYRDAAGARRFHPLGEVNVRMTIGFVARALVDRLASARGWSDDSTWTLRLGRVEADAGAAGQVLLTASTEPGGDDTVAWLEPGPGEG